LKQEISLMVDQNSTPAKPSRLWRNVLVISLALNLAVVGLVIGIAASGRIGEGPPRNFELNLGPIARALEPQERRGIGMSLRRDKSLREFDLRGQVENMVATLQAEPFEPDVLRVLLDEQSARLQVMQGRAQDALIVQIVAMTPERRAEFAEQLRDEMSKARPPRERPSGG
jgi:hypothetical protein